MLPVLPPRERDRLKELLKYVNRIERLGRFVSKGRIHGEYESVFKGSGIEFDRVREFSELDDPKFIDWKVTARLGNPYVKVFHEERGVKYIFPRRCLGISAVRFRQPEQKGLCGGILYDNRRKCLTYQ